MRAYHPRAGRRAFSLVELVFTTAIIGIVAAIALPHWSSSIQNYQLDLAARRLASDLTWARSLANASSTSVVIFFDTNGGAYALSGITDPDHPARTYSVNLSADPYRAVMLSASFGGLQQITFNGYGMPTQGGSVVVGVGSAQRTVSVDANTGGISIQ